MSNYIKNALANTAAILAVTRRETKVPEKPVIIGIIADNFDHYRWAKARMEDCSHFEKASFKPLLRDQDLRAIWSRLTWVLDYRMRYTAAAGAVYHECKYRKIDVRDSIEISKEYGIKF